MTNNIEFIQEVAGYFKADAWYTEDFSKGWTTDLLTGKKVRVKADKHESAIRAQGYMMMEYKAMIEREEAEAQEKAGQASKVEGIKVVIGGTKPEVKEELEPAEVVTVISKDQHTEEMLQHGGLTEKLANHLNEVVGAGKKAKTVEIACVDCGAPRIIKVQDAFQVKRCPNCQKKHRNAKRAERRRQRKAEAKGE